ncbi:hypothetical protein G039_0334070 [Pseudomonas aeruginosa VRFPA01]|nr:hypothetical protein G039_0334070 [Pseudomonas aeruginosa VRFPA01]
MLLGRFVSVGACATAIHYLVLTLLVEGFAVGAALLGPGWLCGGSGGAGSLVCGGWTTQPPSPPRRIARPRYFAFTTAPPPTGCRYGRAA